MPVNAHAKDTPAGFEFITNIGPVGEVRAYVLTNWPTDEEYLDILIDKHGAENVAVTTPAYDAYGHSWDGRAVHIRRES